MNARDAERGQILPLWSAAIITTLTLAFLVVNYGNTVRYQMRAQNAADAAAQALVSIQTQRFNELVAALYAANVEEYRTRRLLDGMLLTLNGAGGCSGQPSSGTAFATGTGTCPDTYNSMLFPYLQSVNRYTTDTMRVNDAATEATYANWVSDVKSMLVHLKSSCNALGTATPNYDGGDCAFQYSLNGTSLRTGLISVGSDAYNVRVGNGSTQATLFPTEDQENPQFFAPASIDIVTCVKVQPIIPAFGVLQAKPHYVIGRAGATAVAIESDWLEPGIIVDPVSTRPTGTQFQPIEKYSTTDNGLAYDWYGVFFGSLTWTDDLNTTGFVGYTSQSTQDAFDAYAAWWGPIPIDPRLVDGTAVNTATECPP